MRREQEALFQCSLRWYGRFPYYATSRGSTNSKQRTEKHTTLFTSLPSHIFRKRNPYSRMKNLLEHVMNSLKLNLHIFCNEATDSRNKSASVKRKIRKSENNMNIKKVLKLRMKKTKLPRTQCTCSCTAAVLILQQDPRCARPIASLEID